MALQLLTRSVPSAEQVSELFLKLTALDLSPVVRAGVEKLQDAVNGVEEERAALRMCVATAKIPEERVAAKLHAMRIVRSAPPTATRSLRSGRSATPPVPLRSQARL